MNWRRLLYIFIGLMLIWGCSGGPGTSNRAEDIADPLVQGVDEVGFRGIDWLTDLDTLENMNPSSRSGLIDLFTRPGDFIDLNGTRLDNIYYGFFDGRFCAAAVTFTTQATGQAIIDNVRAVHGAEDDIIEMEGGEQVYIWDEVLVEVTVSLKQGEGILKYRYKPLFKKIGEL